LFDLFLLREAARMSQIGFPNHEVRRMKLGMNIKAAVVLCGLVAALSACQKQEGPAEKAGKEVDKAVGQVGQQVQKAGASIEDAAKGDKK